MEKPGSQKAFYKLTSTIMLWLQTDKQSSGQMNLGGNLTRQISSENPVNELNPHIANIGRMVEDMENKIRNTLNDIYFGKTRDILNGLRSREPLPDEKQRSALRDEIAQALKRRQAEKGVIAE